MLSTFGNNALEPLPREAPSLPVDSLGPKNVSKNFSAEKNDPLLSNADAIFEGEWVYRD